MEHVAIPMSEFRTSAEQGELALALAAAQGEFPVIEKNKQGKVKGEKNGRAYEYTYMYADIADVLAGVLPVLSKRNLALLQPTFIRGPTMVLFTRLVHGGSGQWMESEYPVCHIGPKHQEMGGALTYARRYALCAMLGVASDEDKDHAHHMDDEPDLRQRQLPKPAPQRQLPPPALSKLAAKMRDALNQIQTLEAVDERIQRQEWIAAFNKLPADDQAVVRAAEARARAELASLVPDDDPLAMPDAPPPDAQAAGDGSAEWPADEIPF